MNTQQLTDIGLTDAQANIYLSLLKHGALTASEAAKISGENRTNTYAVLERLIELELVSINDSKPKNVYKATNPANIEKYVKQQRDEVIAREQKTQALLPDLMHLFFKTDAEPGIRFFKGKKELRQIYEDQARVGEPIYFVLSPDAIDFYGYDHMHELRMIAVRNGIPRYALTPDNPNATKDFAATDAQFLLSRTWMRADDYTAPVEWGVYGDKMYVVSFGGEAIGMIIESPQISQAFRQIIEMLTLGQKSQDWYDTLPKLANRPAKNT